MIASAVSLTTLSVSSLSSPSVITLIRGSVPEGLTTILPVCASSFSAFLSILFIVAAAGFFVLLNVPELFPRILHIGGTTDNRVQIWDLAVNSISESPWFGRGFFGYYQVSLATEGSYVTTHAHNIFIEPLLSFGIIGSLILFICVFILFEKIVLCKNFLRKGGITYLIFALTAGILIHSIIDMTMLWMQTAMLYCVIFGGIGADERTFYSIFKRRRRLLRNKLNTFTED